MSRIVLKNALLNPNVQAFLHAIRLGEGTSDADGYRRLVGGELFGSYHDHPRIVTAVRSGDRIIHSSAAGAYQIIRGTWEWLRDLYHFEDFSPECQDEAAVALIAAKHALENVMDGKISEAIEKCSTVWASLPGSPYGQRTERLDAVLAEYESHGGHYADPPDRIA